MTLLKRANDQTQSEWIPVPEGLWRWIVGAPELKLSEKYGNYQVRFPLVLTQNEKARLEKDEGQAPDGMQQSWRTTYSTGLSLGYIQKDGQYKSTKLIDFLAACLGAGNTKKFRDWVSRGGGPPRPDDLNDQAAELREIEEWLKWWDNLEVYGSIRHNQGESGIVYANFSGPMPVGSLPGQKDNDYDALGRGKLQAIIAESGEKREDHSRESRGLAVVAPAQRFTSNGDEVDDELPF